ncbi:hypothetical protein Tsubulata_030913, partial [Turnera subulata]
DTLTNNSLTNHNSPSLFIFLSNTKNPTLSPSGSHCLSVSISSLPPSQSHPWCQFLYEPKRTPNRSIRAQGLHDPLYWCSKGTQHNTATHLKVEANPKSASALPLRSSSPIFQEAPNRTKPNTV